MIEVSNIANKYTTDKYINVSNPTAYNVVTWLEENGITPIPCQPKTKKPIQNISRDSLKKRMGIAKSDISKDDDIGSYHKPIPERLEIINKWWSNSEFHKDAGVEDESIAVDCVPEYNHNKKLVIIDVDTDELYKEFVDNELFKPMPVIRGGRGCKLLTFITDETLPNYTKAHAITDSTSLVKEQVFEIFIASKRIALVWGEHPDSTLEKSVIYRFIRGFGQEIPTFSYDILRSEFSKIALKYNLLVENSLQNEYNNDDNWSEYISPVGNRESIAGLLNLRCVDIGYPTGKVIKIGDELVGDHPYHGSTHHMGNFRINLSKNIWCCYRCGSDGDHPVGGGPMKLAAVMAGIIQCGDAPRGLSKQQFTDTLEYLRKNGYNTLKAYNQWVRNRKLDEKKEVKENVTDN